MLLKHLKGAVLCQVHNDVCIYEPAICKYMILLQKEKKKNENYGITVPPQCIKVLVKSFIKLEFSKYVLHLHLVEA